MAGTNELQQRIRELSGETIASKLRVLMPDIDAKIKQGVTHDEILTVLNEQGFNLKLATFRSNLQRYRKSVATHGRNATRPTTRATPHVTPDGNPGGDETADRDEPDSTPSLDDIIDPKKRADASDKYMNARPSLRRSTK